MPIPRVVGAVEPGHAESGHQAHRALDARLRCCRSPWAALWPQLSDASQGGLGEDSRDPLTDQAFDAGSSGRAGRVRR